MEHGGCRAQNWPAMALLILLGGCSSSSSGKPAAGTGGSSDGAAGTSGAAGRAGGGASAGGGGSSTSASGGAAGSTSNSSSGMGGAGGISVTSSGGMGGRASAGPGGSGMCLGADIDLIAPTVSGSVTLNGAAIRQDVADVALILAQDAAGGFANLASIPAASGSFATPLVPRTYDLYYSRRSDARLGSTLPSNTYAKFQGGVVVGTSPMTLHVDVPATIVSGTFTFNGRNIPDLMGAKGFALELRNGTRDRAWLTDLSATGSAFSTLVVPGTYDLYYTGQPGRGPLPANRSAKIRSGIVVGTSPLPLALDIPAASVSVTITVGGAPLAGIDSNLLASFLSLENDAGDHVALEVQSAAGISSAQVVAGTYDLYYTPYDAGADVPKNPHAKIRSAILVDSGPLSLAVDVPVTIVSGKLTVNGATVAALGVSNILELRDAAGDTVNLSPDSTGTYRAAVIPGTYDLLYDNTLVAADGVPRNAPAKIKSAIAISGPSLKLDVDIPATPVSGSITVNGAKLGGSRSVEGDGYLCLSNAAGDFVALGLLHPGSFSTFVVPGTYDLLYESATPGTVAPVNSGAVLKKGIVVGSSPLTLDTDIRTVTVSGTVRLNGAPLLGEPGLTKSRLSLHSPDGGNATLTTVPPESIDPPGVATSAYSTIVIPGSYGVEYDQYTSVSPIIGNVYASLGCFNVP